jgi:hypothetical protein
VIVETVSPGFWGNYSLHHKEQVIRGSNTSNFRDDPYEWCSSEVADKLDDTEWNSKCDSLGRRRLQQAPIIHWHAIATSSASELMIAHHRVPRVNGMWAAPVGISNLAMLTCNRKCEKSKGNRPFMKKGKTSFGYGVLTYDVSNGIRTPSIHIHDIGPDTIVAVTGNIRRGRMAHGHRTI